MTQQRAAGLLSAELLEDAPHALALLLVIHTKMRLSAELLPGVAPTTRECTGGNPVADVVYTAADVAWEMRRLKMLATTAHACYSLH